MKTITEMFADLNAKGFPCAYHDDDGDQWRVTGIGQNRDSGLLDRVNFTSAIKILENAGIDHDVKRARHWAVGWVEDLVIRADDDKAIAEIERIRAALANYPVLDDDAYSAAECAQEEEDWQNFGARELRRALVRRLPAWEDAFDRMNADALWNLYRATADAIGVDVTHDTEGANFYVGRVARAMSREAILTAAGWLDPNRIDRIDDRDSREGGEDEEGDK